MSKLSIHESKDGSHTLYSPLYRQYYHNPNGAFAESMHVFFQTSGLIEALGREKEITVFETGFGTGLNLMILADLHRTMGSAARVRYYSVEAGLIGPETARKLNHGESLKHPELMDILPGIVAAPAGLNTFDITPQVALFLFNGRFEDFDEHGINAGFIFHDPFSPEVNPELWTTGVFSRLRDLASGSAVLSTYCAATGARAAMAKAGWLVARAPGALGKREMTLASPDPQKLDGFKRVDEEKLKARFG